MEVKNRFKNKQNRQHKQVIEVLDKVIFKNDWTLNEESMKYQPGKIKFNNKF